MKGIYNFKIKLNLVKVDTANQLHFLTVLVRYMACRFFMLCFKEQEFFIYKLNFILIFKTGVIKFNSGNQKAEITELLKYWEYFI